LQLVTRKPLSLNCAIFFGAKTGQPERRDFLPENRSVQADRFSIGFRKISPTESHPDIAPSFLPFPTGQLLPRLIVVNIRQYLQRRSFSGCGTIK